MKGEGELKNSYSWIHTHGLIYAMLGYIHSAKGLGGYQGGQLITARQGIEGWGCGW